MVEGFPPYRLLAEPLHDPSQLVDTHVHSDIPFEFCSGRLSDTPSEPLLRLASLDSHPSTRLQTHHCIGELPTDYSKAGFGETSEAKPGDRIPGTKCSTTPSGGVTGDREDLKPGVGRF